MHSIYHLPCSGYNSSASPTELMDVNSGLKSD
uniref:Uncharacterized protein n=1 Tax=Anguilla anguilla TaxID=7936 RepID=A0A0E9UL69_ANGAN